MAFELLPTRKDKVAIDSQRFVFECVAALKMKRLQTSALIGDPETLSELFEVIAVGLGLQLKSKDATERVARFWRQNQSELLPLIAEHMREDPELYKYFIKSEQEDVPGSEQTQDKDARQMPKDNSSDAANTAKTDADDSNEDRGEQLTETNQNLSDNVAKIITRNELEATIQNLRTEFNTELERRQKVFEDWQFWTRNEIEFMTERIQKLSESIPDFNHHDDYELSPEPARAGKSHLVKRSKIWGTLDTELEYLLKKEAERRGVTFSRILDSAVWNFFKKPALSFQKKKRDGQN